MFSGEKKDISETLALMEYVYGPVGPFAAA